jgi:hypothetical protein
MKARADRCVRAKAGASRSIPAEAAGLRVSRGCVLAGLFLIFTVVYLFTPHWELAQPRHMQILLAVLTGGVGLLWAFLSSGSVKLQPTLKGAAWFLAALLIAGVLTFRALGADLL